MPHPRFYAKNRTFTLQGVADFIGGDLCQGSVRQASLTQVVNRLASLSDAENCDITFLHNARYVPSLNDAKALACITDKTFIGGGEPKIPCIFHPQPYRAFAKLAACFYAPHPRDLRPRVQNPEGAWVHPGAKVSPQATLSPGVVIQENVIIGSGTHIGAHTVIESGVTIGENCSIGSHVSLQFATLGDGVSLSAGVKIGQAGFGFVMDEKGHVSVPQLGQVIIENHVDIGAGTTIDRGTLTDTIIGEGTRIDNLVQIGHGVQMGRGCVVVAQVGIAGSCILEDHVIIGGQAGIAGHIRIGKGARIAAKSGVMKDIAPGQTVAGLPAVPVTQWHRQTVTLAQMAAPKPVCK
ncbi:MAG: UDP-3-O-(3-hydroxymyristoyl)glucosamine N-acyltransferase [Alphaproteobacteria bacterium]|nr:MAG: UDP-3-O-(3-hydroxymyristoyl)glucosamine N-acyltransferase [Alphaproteobacteria bacterium]